MPITLREFPEWNLILYKHSGEISDDDFLQFYSRNFSYNRDKIIDLRTTDSSFRSTDALTEFAANIEANQNKFTQKTKTAVIAPSHLSFGLARMFKGLSTLIPWDFAVFRSAEKALQWMNIPDTYLSIFQDVQKDLPK